MPGRIAPGRSPIILLNVAERQHISRKSAVVSLVSNRRWRAFEQDHLRSARGVNAYMMAQAGLKILSLAIRRVRLTAASLVAGRPFALKLGTIALAGVMASTIVEEATVAFHNSQLEMSALASVQNETVIYRQERPTQPNANQDYSEQPYTEQIEASDQIEKGDTPSKFPLTVQIVPFVNPDPPVDFENMSAASRDLSHDTLMNNGGFVAFHPKEDADIAGCKGSSVERTRGLSSMDEIDDYLWEAYQRVPLKKDGTGDFTWKDPAAAQHMGLCLQDYVIGGMDPEFREQLYHAGRAMDAAGLQWSMLSAFRDDYRQGLASGYKAGLSNSLHGGSRRTGGYGHGRAIDITGPEGRESEVWKWIDDHGAKYGLHRPLPKADPAHVQQRGDSQKIALALRASRTRSRASATARRSCCPGSAATVRAARSKRPV